jgi:energy-converting hydrogenase B subunit D
MMDAVIQVVLLVLILIAGFLAVRFKDLLSSIVALTAVSLFLSLEFYILQAPDVAIAEAAIAAGLTTAILVLTIRRTRRKEEER